MMAASDDREHLAGGEATHCGCCSTALQVRDPDPWEGRLDDYCLTCALVRCDAYPGACDRAPAASLDAIGHDGQHADCWACGTCAAASDDGGDCLCGEPENCARCQRRRAHAASSDGGAA